MNTVLFSHPSFLRHEVPPWHMEHAGRLVAIDRALERCTHVSPERRCPPVATSAQIEQVHTGRHRSMIERKIPERGLVRLDPDTFMGPSSPEAALRAAGAGIAAVDAVFSKEARTAFVACRPPGHHAEPDRAGGFCLFNNAAIAALHARTHGARKVAVADFDVHHGNGTQAVFRNDPDAFFVSSHQFPLYPGTGSPDERGAHDNIVNAVLASGDGSNAFRKVWSEHLLPALSAFDPDFIVISAGFDAHAADPAGGLELDEADFSWITSAILGIARNKGHGGLVSVLEGGYDPPALGSCVVAHLEALSDF